MNKYPDDNFLLPLAKDFHNNFSSETLNTNRIHAFYEVCTFIAAKYLPPSEHHPSQASAWLHSSADTTY